MDLNIESTTGTRAGVCVWRLTGPFTAPAFFGFQSMVRSLTDPVLIVDVAGVPFMDSAGLGAIMFLHATSLKNQRQYALVGVSERLEKLFKLAGVAEILTTYATAEEAETKLVDKA